MFHVPVLRLCILTLLLTLAPPGIAQSPFADREPVQEAWWARDGGGAGRSVVIDESGHVYAMGSGGGVLLKKYDSAGDLLWTQTFAGDGGSHMVMDSAGDLVIVGQEIVPNDWIVMKVHPDGSLAWRRVFTQLWAARRVAIGPQDSIYVVGSSSGSSASNDYATLKCASDGTTEWIRFYNGPNNFSDVVADLDVAPDGRVAVTGGSTGGVSSFDVATLVYDPDGTRLWLARYNGPMDLADEGNDVAFGPTGEVYVGGWTPAAVGSGSDCLTLAYDPQGSLQWVRTYNGPADNIDFVSRVEVDSSGNPIVIGSSIGNSFESVLIEYDPAGNQQWLLRHYSGGFGEQPTAALIASDDSIYVTGDGGSGQDDYVTFKVDRHGRLVWDILYHDPGVSSNDLAQGIAQGPGGMLAVTGRTPFTTVLYREN